MNDTLKSILTWVLIMTIGLLLTPWVIGIFGWTVEFISGCFPFILEYFNWVMNIFLGG